MRTAISASRLQPQRLIPKLRNFGEVYFMRPPVQQIHRRKFIAAAITTGASLGIPHWARATTELSGMRVFVTSSAGRHQEQAPAVMNDQAIGAVSADSIVVETHTRFQPVLGFGSALTDASCFLLSNMESKSRLSFLSDTYSPQSMALNTGRIAIGSSDYSRSLFNYDDVVGDVQMEHFSIAHDKDYILPMLGQIRSYNPDLFLLATPWSPPGWMKTYGSMLGGYMSAKFLEPYAQYFIKFLNAYAKAGVKVDAVTSQNEVEVGEIGNMPATYWTPELEQDFIRDHLGPALRKNQMDTQIWLLDHNYDLWKRAGWQLRDPKLREYVSGVAWHGYVGTADMMSRLHQDYPEVPFYWTEGGPDYTDPKYATDWTRWGKVFTEAMANWCRGLITWNLMLDPNGKPNIGPFSCGGLVTVMQDSTLSYSGQYWALRHFSQHVRRGAVRVASHSDATDLLQVAFQNPDGSKVVVVTNTGSSRTLRVGSETKSTMVSLAENSVTTLRF